jgi:transposase InsO family protein
LACTTPKQVFLREPPASRSVELAIVEWVAWFNNDRLHEALGDIPPVGHEGPYAAKRAVQITLSNKRATN